MDFFWKYQAPNEGWWANYRWHITKSHTELGIKNTNWKKVFFRLGWQSKLLEIDNVSDARRCLKSLVNGTITAFGGQFRGASYDKNARRMVKQVKNSLEEAIKKHDKEESINIKEIAVAPTYYNWWLIISVSGVVIFLFVIILMFIIRKKKKTKT